MAKEKPSKIQPEEAKKLDAIGMKSMYGMQEAMSRPRETLYREFEKVKEKLTEEEQEAVLKFIAVATEKAEDRYMEAAKENPLNTLITILNDAVKSDQLKQSLEARARELINAIDTRKTIDIAAGKNPLNPTDYIRLLTFNPIIILFGTQGLSTGASDFQGILAALKTYPTEKSVDPKELEEIIKATNNKEGDGKPYYLEEINYQRVKDLPVRIPGLEGVKAELIFYKGKVDGIKLLGSVEFWTRIYDNKESLNLTSPS